MRKISSITLSFRDTNIKKKILTLLAQIPHPTKAKFNFPNLSIAWSTRIDAKYFPT